MFFEQGVYGNCASIRADVQSEFGYPAPKYVTFKVKYTKLPFIRSSKQKSPSISGEAFSEKTDRKGIKPFLSIF